MGIAVVAKHFGSNTTQVYGIIAFWRDLCKHFPAKFLGPVTCYGSYWEKKLVSLKKSGWIKSADCKQIYLEC